MKRSQSNKQTVLVLGAGYCAGPGVHYLAKNGFDVIVGSRTLEKAEALIAGAPNTVVKKIDVENDADLPLLDQVTQEVDAVISMLPYLLHAKAAEIAIKHKKHFLTTSYVSDAMRKLEPAAKEAGVIMINECGVDPGTDHMSAMRLIDKVHAEGGKIVGFSSYCGGLPAPQDNDNPLGYKFSWAPRGVLLASRNSALFLKDGKEVTIPGEVLFENYEIHTVSGVEPEKYEAYPNRNSVQYLDIYKLKEECQSIIRGTYRNIGWCDCVKKFADIGLLDLTEKDLSGKTYSELLSSLLKTKESDDLKANVASQLNLPINHKIIDIFEWLDLFSNNKIPEGTKTNLDALCATMLQKMKYKTGEQDMLLMQHKFEVEFPDKKQTIITKLIDFGIKNGDSSMSRTVSLPVAIVCKLVLQGKYKHLSGLHLPLTPEFYNPILDELAGLNIIFEDKVVAETKL